MLQHFLLRLLCRIVPLRVCLRKMEIIWISEYVLGLPLTKGFSFIMALVILNMILRFSLLLLMLHVVILGSFDVNSYCFSNSFSDVDIIVDFEEVPTFIEFMKIQEELEKILGVKVDLLTEESISPFIRPYIKKIVTVWGYQSRILSISCRNVSFSYGSLKR